MPVIKNVHYERNFALFDKTGLDFDKRLSWAAKGILAYVLAKPAGWETNVNDLVNRSVDGKTVVYNALKELRYFGYVSYKTERGATNQVERCCYYVYARSDNNPEPEDPATISLGKKHQGTDKRKQYPGGKQKRKQNPFSENLKALENQGKFPLSENLKTGKPHSEFLNLEFLKDNKNKFKGCKNNNLWETILEILEKRINPPSFNTWLRPTQLIEVNDKEVIIGVPDEIFVYWLGEYYINVIRDVIEKLSNTKPMIKFQVIETEK